MTRAGGSDEVCAVFDVAGIAVLVAAVDDRRAAMGRTVLTGFAPTGREPVVALTIDDRAAAAPARAPDDELYGVRFWHDDAGATVASSRTVMTVAGDEAVAHVPDLTDSLLVETMAPLTLAWLLARHDRYVVHGGAVAWGDEAFLVLGHSGMGKSTLVAAALEHGWQALSDDLVILAPAGESVRVHGLHRRPAVPLEIGGPVVATGAALGDVRARAELPVGVLRAAGAHLGGTIVVSHSRASGGDLQRIGLRSVVPLVLQSFAATVDPVLRAKVFAFTRRLGEHPAWNLGHAADVRARRAHAGAALARCRSDAAATSGAVSPPGR